MIIMVDNSGTLDSEKDVRAIMKHQAAIRAQAVLEIGWQHEKEKKIRMVLPLFSMAAKNYHNHVVFFKKLTAGPNIFPKKITPGPSR